VVRWARAQPTGVVQEVLRRTRQEKRRFDPALSARRREIGVLRNGHAEI
jgi:hypothetical protein